MTGLGLQAAQTLAYLLIALPAALIGCLAFASVTSKQTTKLVRQTVHAIAAAQAVVSLAALLLFSVGQFQWENTFTVGPEITAISLLIDGVSLVMFALVSFIGWAICKYSIQYLDGEKTQSRYFAWTAFTIGSVCLMVLSGNLVMLAICWMMTSFGLHHLLLHYSDRPAAQRAAWTKFVVSRIGDGALVVASIIIYQEFGTTQLTEIFAAIGLLESFGVGLQAAGFLLAVCAITKSAQVPFHTWLPLTMETPTPVSALMHAGVVNAGGYLIVRTSPIVAESSAAMMLLIVVGMITVCYAGVVMLTQTSIKKSLAYSTSAQMGFMMLQVGLGAYSAAMLHIVAHSLYKAHAFLSSGSVLNERAAMKTVEPTAQRSPVAAYLAAALTLASFIAVSFSLFSINPQSKPGGVLLAAVLLLGLTSWLGNAFRSGNKFVITRAIASGAGLCLAYAVSFKVIDGLVSSDVPSALQMPSVWMLWAIAAVGFGVLVSLQYAVSNGKTPAWIDALRVHAANGFYVESMIRRFFGPLRSS